MAITNELSDQAKKVVATPPLNVATHEWHGRVRQAYFNFTQGAAAGDANSTAQLIYLPNRPVRLLMADSWVYHSAFGAARLLDIGWAAYEDKDGNQVAEDLDGLAAGLDVAAAGTKTPQGVVGGAETKVFLSKGGVWIMAQVRGGTIPAGAQLEGVFKYVTD